MKKLGHYTIALMLALPSILYSSPKSIDCDDKTDTEKTAAKLVAVAKTKRKCPNIESLRGGLCQTLRIRLKDKNDQYAYITAIREASCVDLDTDDEETQNSKIQKFWSTFEDQLICDANDFNVQKGNIIKFAVAKKFESFIDDVIEWGVNLNRIDPKDQMTVLDYIDSEINNNKGSPIENELKRYKNSLRDAGAKYAKEIK